MRKRYWPFSWLIAIGLTAAPAWSGPDDGILGMYYDRHYFDANPTLTRIDPSINFDWGENPPDPTMRNSQFCVRWLGELEVPSTEAYTFVLRADGNAGLWIDDRPIIDRAWRGMTPVEKEATINLVAGRVYPIVVEYEASGFGATIRLSWQSPSLAQQIIPPGGLHLPLRARTPSPATEAAETVQHPTLRWKAGYRAIHHDVYFGHDANAVAIATPASAGIYRGRQPLDETEFDPGPLDWNMTYYWRGDEVNEAHPESPWKGPIWRFATANFLLVDDFESYTDEEGERLYEFWIDGWYEENGTGSIVGYYMTDQLPVVHSGRESMPFEYNNVSVPYYSEAYRTWDTPQDWTVHGLTCLRLWVIGQPIPLAVRPNGNIALGIPVSHSAWGGYSALRFGYKQATGDCEITAKVEDFKDSPGVMRAGVMIRKEPDSYLQPEYVAVGLTANDCLSFERHLGTKGNVVQDEPDARPSARWVKLSRNGNTFSAHHSADGIIWEPSVDTQGEPVIVYLAMGQTAYIGLYMIGNTGRGNSTAEFSGIAFTGSVSGEWQVTDAEWGNAPDSFYVAVEDTPGRIAVAVHPGSSLVNAMDWTQWRIPLSDFADMGVDLTAIRKLYIGIGDRGNPQPAGKGLIHIDNIRVVREAQQP
jgi:hypothetical protein